MSSLNLLLVQTLFVLWIFNVQGGKGVAVNRNVSVTTTSSPSLNPSMVGYQTTNTTTLPPSKQTVLLDTTNPPPTTKEPACVDLNPECKRWALYGYCYYGYIKQYMVKICRKSCTHCAHKDKCRDTLLRCPHWVLPRHCKYTIIKRWCRNTCNTCPMKINQN